MKNDALFCVGQKALIEKDSKILILNDPMKHLDFPGGKIQEGEARVGDASSLIDALKREVIEETGLEITVSDPFAVWYYEFPELHRNYGKVVYLIAFKCQYISGEIQLSDEHNNFQWVDKKSYKLLDDGSEHFGVLEKYFNESQL